MLDNPRLLVVDDEEAICEGCRRIFSRQGFEVEKTTDARQGLLMAVDRPYAAVLVDIKMPELDGIEFLEKVRANKPQLPVILMTGYPSIPNAVAAVRLGASGYVTKPFTPEEVSQAVYKYVQQADTTPAAKDTWSPSGEAVAFWHEAWLLPGADGSVRTGVLLPRSQTNGAKVIRLPKIGEVVYQGLPLAAIRLADGTGKVLPAPASGLVVAVHEALAEDASALACDPCGEGWIAAICPTRIEEETKVCTRRKVALFNSDAAAADAQQKKLAALGCQVKVAGRWEELAPMLESGEFSVLVMDAARFGDDGPAMVSQVNSVAPATKVVVVAPAGCQMEAAYRAKRLFYYAVEAFADNEIADVLDAAFACRTAPPAEDRRKAPPGSLCSILITNRNGRKVRLVVQAKLLRREDGMGAMIRHKLLDRLFPMETVSGDADLDPANIVGMAANCDRLVVLLTKDLGMLPGSMVRDTKAEFVSITGDGAGKVTFLAVQPDAEGGLSAFDARTTAALVEHVVGDMAAY